MPWATIASAPALRRRAPRPGWWRRRTRRCRAPSRRRQSPRKEAHDRRHDARRGVEQRVALRVEIQRPRVTGLRRNRRPPLPEERAHPRLVVRVARGGGSGIQRLIWNAPLLPPRNSAPIAAMPSGGVVSAPKPPMPPALATAAASAAGQAPAIGAIKIGTRNAYRRQNTSARSRALMLEAIIAASPKEWAEVEVSKLLFLPAHRGHEGSSRRQDPPDGEMGRALQRPVHIGTPIVNPFRHCAPRQDYRCCPPKNSGRFCGGFHASSDISATALTCFFAEPGIRTSAVRSSRAAARRLGARIASAAEPAAWTVRGPAN